MHVCAETQATFYYTCADFNNFNLCALSVKFLMDAARVYGLSIESMAGKGLLMGPGLMKCAHALNKECMTEF